MREIKYVDFSNEDMMKFADGLNMLNKKWNLEMSTCSEKIDLNKYSIGHSKCIDDDLLSELFPDDFNVFTTDATKDKGQRAQCGCIISKDIGQYNTCPHGCTYCYANTSKEIAIKNYKYSMECKDKETILPFMKGK